MKKLLLTSAILTLAMTTNMSLGNVNANLLTETIDFTQVYKQAGITQKAVGLHNGDFEIIAKTVYDRALYTGLGAVAMTSMNMERY